MHGLQFTLFYVFFTSNKDAKKTEKGIESAAGLKQNLGYFKAN